MIRMAVQTGIALGLLVPFINSSLIVLERISHRARLLSKSKKKKKRKEQTPFMKYMQGVLQFMVIIIQILLYYQHLLYYLD